MAPAGFVAVLAGWTTTEVGRQPWTVYGLMRTADSVTPSLTGGDVLVSLLGYMVVYLVIFPTGVTLMARIVRAGPAQPAVQEEIIASGRPSRPVTALPGGEAPP
jgi:cytochrome d ubiquinol oxidase subunit I